MSDGQRNGRWKQRFLLGIAGEAGVQLLAIPAVGAALLLLAEFIWAHR